jgi:hypothetical protein
MSPPPAIKTVPSESGVAVCPYRYAFKGPVAANDRVVESYRSASLVVIPSYNVNRIFPLWSNVTVADVTPFRDGASKSNSAQLSSTLGKPVGAPAARCRLESRISTMLLPLLR